MNIEMVRNYCISKKGVEESFPFNQDVLVFKVMGKMFACLDLSKPQWLTVKCDADYAQDLRDKYEEIEDAFHFNKKYWNQIDLEGRLEDEFIFRLIDHSFQEVYKKFTKKMKSEYEML